MSNKRYRVAVLTASDRGAAGVYEDLSGPCICGIMAQAGYEIVEQKICSDEREMLQNQLLAWSESGAVDLILTTGGTGLSPRDCMPEATLAVADRLVPGIAEALRSHSMRMTPRAMLSRAASVVCGQTLIINLPGSPKAVREQLEFLLLTLPHGLEVLCGGEVTCAAGEGVR
jgi:molybdenum cofactor synthesis domain